MFWVEYLIQLIYISIVTLLLLIILPILEKIFRARSLRILLCFMAALYLFPVGFLTNVLTIIPKEQEGSIVRNFSILSRTITVSYTHLDVYKRQEKSGWSPAKAHPEEILSVPTFVPDQAATITRMCNVVVEMAGSSMYPR